MRQGQPGLQSETLSQSNTREGGGSDKLQEETRPNKQERQTQPETRGHRAGSTAQAQSTCLAAEGSNFHIQHYKRRKEEGEAANIS